MSTQKLIWALSRLAGFGIQTFKELKDRIPNFEELDASQFLEVIKSFIDPDSSVELDHILNSSEFDQELDLCHSKNIQLITILDSSYPKNLLSIYDPPFLLYVKGNLIPDDQFAIAVVGSRTPSMYGLRMAAQFSEGLSERGMTIVSGLARGIDGEAHRATLKVKGRTIAVLGCGVDIVYPKEHSKLYQEIAEHGAVMSEFPMGAPPQTYHFPKRNRIISGLSLGVLVVEASQKSGSLITASVAGEEGREVYAIPGAIDSVTSQGSNQLIQNGAKLVTSVEDIFVDLKDQMKDILHPGLGQEKKVLSLASEDPILKLLVKEPLSFDEIMLSINRDHRELYSQLMDLELNGKIKRIFGGKFVRTQELAMT